MLEFPPLFWSLYHVWLFWLFIQWTIFHCFAHSLCLMLWLSMPILLPLISSKAWGYMCILLIHCVSRFYAYIAYIPLQSLCSFCISVHVYTYRPLMYVYASSAYTFMYVYTPSAWSLSMFMFVLVHQPAHSQLFLLHMFDFYPCIYTTMQLDDCPYINGYAVSLPCINTYVDKFTILAHYPHVLLCFCAFSLFY